MKSQFEVCGAMIITNFGSSVRVPSNVQPMSVIIVRPIQRVSAFPREGIRGPSDGTYMAHESRTKR